MTSQKRCCPAVNGLRRMRPVVGVLAISCKKKKERVPSLCRCQNYQQENFMARRPNVLIHYPESRVWETLPPGSRLR